MSIVKSKYLSLLFFSLLMFSWNFVIAQVSVFDSSANARNEISSIEIMQLKKFDVVVMNYSNLSSVLRYKKLEFGVELPDEVATRINRYLHEQGIYSNELNPFLEWEIDLEATFYHIASGTIKKIDGYYTRDYIANQKTDDWDDVETNYPFRIRFAPPLNGEWTATINIHINKEILASYSSDEINFNVIESGDLGYVKVFENNRNLKLGDKMIFPVGTNFPADFPCVAWAGDCYDEIPGDSVRMLNGDDTIYYGHNLYTPQNSEKASNVYAWNQYLTTLSEYFNSGGKYIRTIQMPWSSLIEFEQKGNYYKRLHYAWEQDKLLDSLEKYDALMVFNLMLQSPHMQYEHTGTKDWDWDYDIRDENGKLVKDSWVYEQPRYCYNDKPQGEKKANESFTNENDLEYHKQRTRYYLSRYGYSTKIMEFEILSEPFHLGVQAEMKDSKGNVVLPELKPYNDGNVAKDAIYNYYKVISEYMKDSLQTNQLVGINMGYDVSIDLQSITLPKIDVAGVNFYYNSPAALYKEAKDKIVTALWNSRGSKIPILFTEGGLDVSFNECSDLTQHPVDMMTFPFASVSAYFTWVGWRKEIEGQLWPATVAAQDYINGLNVLETLSEGDGNWFQWKEVAESNEDKKYAVEQQYYVSENQNSAVGYVKNRTYNIANQNLAGKSCYRFEKELYNSVHPISWDEVKKKDRLRVDRLKKKTRYQVDWYSIYNAENNGYIKSDCITTTKKNGVWGFVLEYPKLGKEITGTADFPVVWYVIREGCGQEVDLKPATPIENKLEKPVPLKSNEIQREKTYLD